MKLNTSELKSFFYGTLLGDSYIHNNVFYCKQISKDLIEFKAMVINKFLPDAIVKISEHAEQIDKNGVHHQKYWTLSVHGSKYIKELAATFYPNGKKIYPKGIIQKLTPLGLAMWYADDGTTVLVGKTETTGGARSRRVDICTDSFTRDEHLMIQHDLASLGFTASLIQRDKFYRIRINNRQNFLLTIAPYFTKYFPSLSYKMDLGYRNESLLNRRYVSEEYYKFYLDLSACPGFIDRMKIGEDIV